MKRTIPIILILVLAFVLVFAACGNPSPTPTTAPTATPKPTQPSTGPTATLAAVVSTATPLPTPTRAPTVAPATATPTPVLKPITLRVAEFQTADNIISQNGPQFFMKEVERLSGGRLKFDFFPAEQLLKANDAPDGVAKGIADIGNMTYITGKITIISMAQIPGIYSDDQAIAAVKALWKITKGGYIEQEFNKNGLQPLWVEAIPNYQIFTAKIPVKTLADFKGLKLRTAGTMMPRTIESLGAASVNIPAADAYDAMERGTLDGSTLTMSSLPAQPWAELVKNVTVNVDLGGLATYWAMNKATWDSLPSDIKKIISDVGDTVGPNCDAALVKFQQDLVKQWQDKGTKQVFRLSEADRAAVAAAGKTAGEAWLKDQESKGVPATQVLQAWQDAIKAELGTK